MYARMLWWFPTALSSGYGSNKSCHGEKVQARLSGDRCTDHGCHQPSVHLEFQAYIGSTWDVLSLSLIHSLNCSWSDLIHSPHERSWTYIIHDIFGMVYETILLGYVALGQPAHIGSSLGLVPHFSSYQQTLFWMRFTNSQGLKLNPGSETILGVENFRP